MLNFFGQIDNFGDYAGPGYGGVGFNDHGSSIQLHYLDCRGWRRCGYVFYEDVLYGGVGWGYQHSQNVPWVGVSQNDSYSSARPEYWF